MSVYFFGKSDRGVVRSNNEDFFFAERIGEEEYLFAVADGMGGHLAGEVASRKAIETLVKEFTKKTDEPLPSKIRRVFDKINKEIITEGNENLEQRGMGTTLSALYIKKDRAFIAHVGDSRIYYYNGSLSQLTEDHSFVGKLVKDGLISPEEAKVHPKRNILYQSMGMRRGINVQIEGPIKIKEGDKFLICSDGLTAVVDDEEIESLFGKDLSPKKMVNELIETSLKRGAPDNVTVIVVTTKYYDETKEYHLKKVNKKKKKLNILLFIVLILLIILSFLLFNLYKKSKNQEEFKNGKIKGEINFFQKQSIKNKIFSTNDSFYT